MESISLLASNSGFRPKAMAMASNFVSTQLCCCSTSSSLKLSSESHRWPVASATPSIRGPSRSSRNSRARPSSARLKVVVASASSSGGGGQVKQENQRDEKRSSPATAPVPPTTGNAVPGSQESQGEDRKDSESVLESEMSTIARSEAEIARIQTEGESEGRDWSSGSVSSAGERSPDEIGNALSELRKARAAMGAQDPSTTPDFWKGVVEETKQIEWPVFSKILGTTGVVLAMILGSSVVLLTVNGVLSAGSDFLFNDPGFQSFAKTFLNLSY